MKIADNQDNTVFAHLGKVCKSLIVSILPPPPENSHKFRSFSRLCNPSSFSNFQSCFESAFVVSFPGRAACKDFQKRNFMLQKMVCFIFGTSSVSLVLAVRGSGLTFSGKISKTK